MGQKYQINGSQFLAAFAQDPEQFAQFLVDTADEQTNLGGFEPIEEMVKQQLLPYLVRGISGVQAKFANVQWQAESS
jgi:hypothetical protein